MGEPRLKQWLAHLGKMGTEWVRPMSPPASNGPALLRETLLRAGLPRFLERSVAARGPTTLVVNDPERFTDTRCALETVLELARGEGVEPRFRVVFATGSHRFTSVQRRDHERRCLPPGLSGCPRRWHDAQDSAAVLALGDVRLHRWVAGSELLLVVGSMEPHYFAGVTGAHKTVSVGVMSYDSLRDHHAHALSTDARALRLEGNPVFEATARVVRRLQEQGKQILAVNEVLVGARIVACTAGDPLDALTRGLVHVRRAFSRCLVDPVDLVVARVGPPLNRSLYQADKGIKNVENAVRDGGVILLEASCEEGVGIDRFMRLMARAPDLEKALALVRVEGYRLGDHKAVRLRRLTAERRVHVGIVSPHLPAEAARVAGLVPFRALGAAAEWAVDRLGDQGRRALIVEDAGNMTLTLDPLKGRGGSSEPPAG